MARGKSSRRRASALPASTALMLAPAVVLMRLPLMAAEAAQAGSIGRETARAVTEKAGALAEGLVAAQIACMRAAATFWPEVIAGKTPSLISGAVFERSMVAALAPASKRVRANYRRLSRP